MSLNLNDQIEAFYRQALTVNSRTTPAEVLKNILAPDFRSLTSHEAKDRETLIKQLEFFWKLIPDLAWTPVDKVTEGDKFVVRSVATGTPKGDFMGIPCDGTKSFKIDTIDIHEFSGDRIVRVHHLEDWASAMRQLRS